MDRLTERITGDNRISGFVDIYNRNNDILESKIRELEEKIGILTSMTRSKVDKSVLDTVVGNEVNRIMDVEYNSDNNPRRFVRHEEVVDIVKETVKGK